MTTVPPSAPAPLDTGAAATYAAWFACLADPTRVRLLHAVATAADEVAVGVLADRVGISQPTCSHHVKKLAEVGFVRVRKDGTTTLVSVNEACCVGLPHAAEAVMGTLAARPCCPADLPDDVVVRPLREDDWPAVRAVYADGIATRNATFETAVPPREALDRQWLPHHRWVARVGGQVAGWAAAARVSARSCYAGVAETSVYVGDGFRGRGVGRALLHRQVTAADEAGLWTLQTSVFPENRASVALHRSAGFRIVGVRERIGQLDGRWRDTVLLERRSASSGTLGPGCAPDDC